MPSLTMPLYIFTFLLGITVGSFLNVCILRIPAGESIVTGPSHCTSCGRRLAWYEMIPVLSWLALRGRCRTCGAAISPQYPLIEAANGFLWLLVTAALGFTPDALLGCLMTSALLVLSVIDARTGEIPPGTAIFIAALGAARLVLHPGLTLSLLLGAAAVSGFLLLVLLVTGGRGVGGGDVKLMAACGLLLGWKLILLAFLLGCLLGSAVHLVRMRFFGAGRVLALGPYLSAGVFLSLLWGDALLTWYFGLL